jgi:hypothetical protein
MLGPSLPSMAPALRRRRPAPMTTRRIVLPNRSCPAAAEPGRAAIPSRRDSRRLNREAAPILSDDGGGDDKGARALVTAPLGKQASRQAGRQAGAAAGWDGAFC